MNRIYIEIIRTNGELDLYRFEPSNLADNHYDRAFNFLRDTQLTREDVKDWVMRNNPRGLRIEDYDVIED